MKLKHYQGAGIMLIKKSVDGYSVLLGKRKYNPGKGKWSVPGGEKETYDSDLLCCAKREFREELGVRAEDIVKDSKPIVCKIKIPFFFNWQTFIYEIDSDWTFSSERIHEFTELKFIPFSELKNYRLAFGVKTEIRKFITTRQEA